MKVFHLIISLISVIFLIKNAESVNQPKLNKSFDEIFGKGWDDESNDAKDLNCRHVKEEVQDGQAPNTSDQKNIEAEILKQKFDEIYAENLSDDGVNSAPSPDDLDQENSKEAKNLSDLNNSTDQDLSVDKQQNESNECRKVESDQQKLEIIQKFREMKDAYRQKGHTKEWVQIETKLSNGLGVSRRTMYKWIKKLGLRKETKPKFCELEKRQILKQFDEIKSKCKKANLKNISMHELDKKIAKKLGVSAKTIYKWKREFGLSVNNKISDATKIGILKKYAKIKEKNPKMSDSDIADLFKISRGSIHKWKVQFREEIKNI